LGVAGKKKAAFLKEGGLALHALAHTSRSLSRSIIMRMVLEMMRAVVTNVIVDVPEHIVKASAMKFI
jgi:hypothetical protein